MSWSPATGPSAELIRYAHGSTRIVRTCRPCVTPVLLTTRGSAHRPRSIGCPACMNGNYSSSPEEESATGRPVRDPLATQDDPAKFLNTCHHDRRVLTRTFRRYASGAEDETSSRGHARYSRTRLVCSRSSPSGTDPVSSTETRRSTTVIGATAAVAAAVVVAAGAVVLP